MAYSFSREARDAQQQLLSTVAAGITHVVLHYLMEIASGEPFQRPNFFDEIQTKSLKSFPPCYSKSPLCLEIFFLQTHATSYIFFSAFLNTVKEKGGNLIKNYTPFPMVKKIQTETSCLENSQEYSQKPQRNFTFMNSASGLCVMESSGI
jgi:hypothetical protein